jgi:hypothetical protein
VNTFIMLHTKEFKITFKIRNFGNFEFVVLFLDPKLLNNGDGDGGDGGQQQD